MAGATLTAAREAITRHVVVTGTVQKAVGSISASGASLAAVWPRPSKATLTLASHCNTVTIKKYWSNGEAQGT